MPPRAVICELCGGKFFRSSLAIHQKTCRTKVGVQMHECPYCHAGVPMLEMDIHVTKCPEARAAGAKPTGASASLAKRLETNRQRSEAGLPHPCEVEDSRAIGGNAGRDGPSEYGGGDDVRIACQACGRKFNMDRVTKHQAICEKLKAKGPRPEYPVQRSYMEGGSKGTCIGVAAAAPSGRGRSGKGGRRVVAGETGLANKPLPRPCKSNWRQASLSWRDAIRSGRASPLPQWGQDSARPGGRGGRASYASHSSASPTRPSRSPSTRGGGGVGGGSGFSSVSSRGPRASVAVMSSAAVGPRPHGEHTDQGRVCVSAKSRSAPVAARLQPRPGSPFDNSPSRQSATSSTMATRTSGFAAGSAVNLARQRNLNSTTPATVGSLGRNGIGDGGRSFAPNSDRIAGLPEWGSGGGSRYGRNCMTSPPGATLRRGGCMDVDKESR
eukprot:TRINITY_DN21931_c0_g1_i1.p1 TRINITY_DN21931_c0_g1~~TRINITY_DN21931_c0_g1_i1.p1  ORF type:complete len:440 (-),score=41.01 TRINITY_DN21931_c0_g1_i1:154-1473(-)